MAETVLDASALLALLGDEPGGGRVTACLPEALMSAVNLAEVAGVLIRSGVPPVEARGLLDDLALTVIPFDEDHAHRAAALRPATRAAGLSLGDRACLALAQSRNLPALTADRAWGKLKIGIRIEVIR